VFHGTGAKESSWKRGDQDGREWRQGRRKMGRGMKIVSRGGVLAIYGVPGGGGEYPTRVNKGGSELVS